MYLILLVTNNDIAKLPNLLQEIIKYILLEDDNNLLKYLKKGVRPSRDLFLDSSNNIITIIYRLVKAIKDYKYVKLFALI